MAPLASLKRTKIRLTPGENATIPRPITKMPKVGVSPASIAVKTLVSGGARHTLVAGLVWQTITVIGRFASPVSAETLMAPLTPTLTVATANAFAPSAPGMSMIPSRLGVATSPTMSGTGNTEADSSSVLTPGVFGAALALAQKKLNDTSVGAKEAIGVSAMTKVCAAPSGMLAGVLGVPVSVLVAG